MTTPNELGRLIEEMTDQISDAYQNNTTGYVLVRHFQFIHRNIDHLTEEVMRHQTERQQVFDYMMDNNGF